MPNNVQINKDIQEKRENGRKYRERMKTESLYKMSQILDFGLIKSMFFFLPLL